MNCTQTWTSHTLTHTHTHTYTHTHMHAFTAQHSIKRRLKLIHKHTCKHTCMNSNEHTAPIKYDLIIDLSYYDVIVSLLKCSFLTASKACYLHLEYMLEFLCFRSRPYTFESFCTKDLDVLLTNGVSQVCNSASVMIF